LPGLALDRTHHYPNWLNGHYGTSSDEGGAILLSELMVYNNRETLLFINRHSVQVSNCKIMCNGTILTITVFGEAVFGMFLLGNILVNITSALGSLATI